MCEIKLYKDRKDFIMDKKTVGVILRKWRADFRAIPLYQIKR